MKKFALFTSCWAVFLAAGAAGALEPIAADQARGLGNACPPPAAACDPLWTVDVGAVILRRQSTNFANAFEPFEFGFEAGVDADIRRRIGEQNQIQVRYFGVDTWSDQPVRLEPPTNAFHDYDSSLHSTEINLRSQRTDWMTLLGGFRWVELQDNRFFDQNVDSPTSNLIDIGNQNHLYGAQVGTDFLLWDRGGPFTFNTEMKAGIFSNLAKSRRERLESPGAPIPPVGVWEDRSRRVAFVGDLGLNAKYRLTDNLAVRGGYHLMWVEGVSLADAYENRFDGETALDTRGSLFYHGATVGGEFRW